MRLLGRRVSWGQTRKCWCRRGLVVALVTGVRGRMSWDEGFS